MKVYDVDPWQDPSMVGAVVDLYHRSGTVRRGGRIELLHGDYSATIRFPGEEAGIRYWKRDWIMLTGTGPLPGS